MVDSNKEIWFELIFHGNEDSYSYMHLFILWNLCVFQAYDVLFCTI